MKWFISTTTLFFVALPLAQYHSLPGPPALDSFGPAYGSYGILAMSAPAYPGFSMFPDRLQAAAFDVDEEDNDFDIRIEDTTEQLSTTIDPLEPYSLKEFPWALPLLDAASDSLLLQVNGTQVHLKLTKDNDALPTDAGSAVACTNASGGAPGQCLYLTRCTSARSLTAALYETAYCVYDSGYAGVCCPEHKDDTAKP